MAPASPALAERDGDAADALASVLAHPAIWRGADCAPEPAAVPSGFAALDAVLPGGGWPRGLTEIVLAREGIGEIRLALPALARVQAEGLDVVWIAPPWRPYAPALVAAGLDPRRLIVVRCGPRDALWACEQALRAPECGAAFAWLPARDERVLRRLQVAAREGRTLGMLWRRPGEPGRATAAPLRLALSAAADGRLAVRVLKRRGGELAAPLSIDVTSRWRPSIGGITDGSAGEPIAWPRRRPPLHDRGTVEHATATPRRAGSAR